jgi:hypothetical protein
MRTAQILAWVLGGSVVAGSACGGDDDHGYLAERASEVRELPLLADVDVVEKSREEYSAEAEEYAASITDEDLREYADTYGRLGFFPQSLDLRPIIAGSSSDWVGASYSPAGGQITLVGQARDDTIVHEYVHALQDQHFDLYDYDDYETSDGFLARRAVVEGDAVLAEGRFVMQEEYGADLDSVYWPGLFADYRGFSVSLLEESGYPSIFMDYPTFCYTYGIEYTAHNLTGVSIDDPAALQPGPYDWTRENDLFTDRPPATTQQILRLDDTDPIVDVGLVDPPALLANRLTAVDRDVFGEWYSYLLFFEIDRDVAAARALAALWDGDRAMFVSDRETLARGVVWASAWDDEAAATAVAVTMWRLYGVAVDPEAPVEPSGASAIDGEPLWIEQRGARVVVIKNVDPAIAPDLADASFGPATQIRVTRARPSLAELLQFAHE